MFVIRTTYTISNTFSAFGCLCGERGRPRIAHINVFDNKTDLIKSHYARNETISSVSV